MNKNNDMAIALPEEQLSKAIRDFERLEEEAEKNLQEEQALRAAGKLVEPPPPIPEYVAKLVPLPDGVETAEPYQIVNGARLTSRLMPNLEHPRWKHLQAAMQGLPPDLQEEFAAAAADNGAPAPPAPQVPKPTPNPVPPVQDRGRGSAMQTVVEIQGLLGDTFEVVGYKASEKGLTIDIEVKS